MGLGREGEGGMGEWEKGEGKREKGEGERGKGKGGRGKGFEGKRIQSLISCAHFVRTTPGTHFLYLFVFVVSLLAHGRSLQVIKD